MPGRGLGHLSALLTFSPSPEVAEYMKFIDEGHASSSGPREPDFHMRNTTRVQRLELLSEIARRPTLRTQRIEPFYRWDKPGKPFYDDMRNTHRTQRIEPFYDDMRNTHRTQRAATRVP
jgi:hypothetical protein